jgi:hypothetical protein
MVAVNGAIRKDIACLTLETLIEALSVPAASVRWRLECGGEAEWISPEHAAPASKTVPVQRVQA